jgi:L-fucose isomerase-like protein
VHTNRRQALLLEFALRPGRVTLFRLSQARGRAQVAIATGEMLDRPMAFTGTSGVMRFDRGARAVRDDVMASGLEHHMALAYGDHAEALRGVAARLGVPVMELGA